MQRNEALMELIEQAASRVNMLSPADLSDIDQLQAIFSQIGETITQIKDGPAMWLEQTQSTASGISELLQKMLEAKAQEESDALIDSVSQAVMTLQALVDQAVLPETWTAATAPASSDNPTENTAPESVGKKVDKDDVPLVQDFITESREHLESAEAGLLELETRPEDKEVLNLIFRSFHTIKGMAGFLNLTDIGSLAHSTENLLDFARKGQLLLTGGNVDVVFESIDLLKKMIVALNDAIETDSPVATQKNLTQLIKKVETSASYRGDAAAAQEAKPADQKIETPPPSAENTSDTAAAKVVPVELKSESVSEKDADHKAGSAEEKIKVSTTRLDNLVNMAGELVIAQLMVAEEARAGQGLQHELVRKISHQGKIIRELQELSMSMRMVQISGVFQKMTRLVRDVSRKAEKKINFVTVGEETELDRSVVDKIADPLIHMLRNCVDHGIESAEGRQRAGKDPVGRVELRAFHQAGNIVIEVEDDGKGLDKERILKKALDNGIVDAQQQLTDEQIYKLVFHAGLSTAEKVTSISGRGVGMDVVKKNIDSLRGRIDIASTPGKGTIFTIRLPLTLAMIDGQIVTVGQDRYIIPINSIVGTLRPQAEQISTVQNRFEMVMVRGQLMPLIRLYQLFSVTPATENPTEALLVVVEDDERKCCLLVDDLLAQQRVVIKNLGEGLGKVNCVSGGAIMGDGRVSLILDIPSLMMLARN